MSDFAEQLVAAAEGVLGDPFADVPPPDDLSGITPRRIPLTDRLLSVSELANIPPAEPLVDGFIYRGTLAQLSAKSGSYKTFITVAMVCSLALGEDWEGYRVPKREKVVYVAAEGDSGMYARIAAWCELSGHDLTSLDGWLTILPGAMQLGDVGEVSEMHDIVKDLDAGLVVIDTRAKCTLGMDENSATDQGRAIAASERLVSAGCAVLVIHHAGRSGSNPRGSSAWDGGVWSDLRMEGSDFAATVTCEKHKDAPSQCKHTFRMVPHTVSEDLMPGVSLARRATLVAVSRDDETTGQFLTPSVRQVWNALETAPVGVGLSPNTVVDVADTSKASVYRGLKTLQDQGFVTNIGTDKRPAFTCTNLGRQQMGGA